MTVLQTFGDEGARTIIRLSNYWAKKNGNQYPVQMNNAINELYEFVDCPCDEGCRCKTLGCTHHWKMRDDVTAAQFQRHFLQCFVNQKLHEKVISKDDAGSHRGAAAAQEVYRKIANDWNTIRTLSHGYTALCSNPGLYQEIRGIKLEQGLNIYLSKLYCLLNLDSNFPFDSGSKRQLSRDLDSDDLGEIHKSLGDDLATLLPLWNVNIDELRGFDVPQEFFQLNPFRAARPLGRILDKLYYSP